MSNVDKFYDRCDPMWAHELIKDTYMPNPGYAYNPFNPEATLPILLGAREYVKQMFQTGAFPEDVQAIVDNGTLHTDFTCPGLTNEDPEIPLYVWLPEKAKKRKVPVLLCIHSGGLTCGSPETDAPTFFRANADAKYAIVAPRYRMAPESKYPAAVDDCHATFLWILEHAKEYNFDTKKIIIFGGSSGGHLGAALSHRLYANGLRARGQVLLEPTLEDRNYTESSKYSSYWSKEAQKMSYLAWLGENYNSAEVGPDAVPGHATDEEMKGLPPTCIYISENDINRDAVIGYAQKLYKAGVFCRLMVWGGMTHGSTATLEFDNPINEEHRHQIKWMVDDLVAYNHDRPWIRGEE